jgi:hypothetical protein
VQICCPSAIGGLFLLVFGEELIAILNDDELMVFYWGIL